MAPFAMAANTLSDHLMAQLGAPTSVNAYRAPQGGEAVSSRRPDESSTHLA